MTPERLQALQMQGRLFPGQTLPDICMDLRAAVNGAADPWPEESVKDTLALLRRRLAVWEDGLDRSRAFDDAVKAMVQATIWEVESYRAETRQ